jgi:hypothetical protein
MMMMMMIKINVKQTKFFFHFHIIIRVFARLISESTGTKVESIKLFGEKKLSQTRNFAVFKMSFSMIFLFLIFKMNFIKTGKNILMCASTGWAHKGMAPYNEGSFTCQLQGGA